MLHVDRTHRTINDDQRRAGVEPVADLLQTSRALFPTLSATARLLLRRSVVRHPRTLPGATT